MIIDLHSGSLELAERRTVKEARSSRRRRRKDVELGRALQRLVPITPAGWYATVKIGAEYGVGLILAALAAPVILTTALVVKLTSKGPAFYTQTRVGRKGRLFNIYKIRTMIHECESLTGPRWSMPGDPRITWIGHILRKTHLDELPQLLNLLRGEMGLIGPRPERPEFIPRLERVLPEYRDRLAIRPGITGLAQVHFAADTDMESVRRKLSYDLHYIRHFRFGMDLRILAATVFYALGNPFGVSRKIAGVREENVTECRFANRIEEEPVRMKRCA